MDKRALRRWAATRPRTPLRYLGADEFFVGKTAKFLTVVSDLETGEPLWVGRERKQETLDRFFADALPPARRRAVRAVCVDMREPFRLSLQEHLPQAKLVCDKFHACATPVRPWTRPAGQNSSDRGPRRGGSSAASAGCCCAGGPTSTARSAKPSAACSPSTGVWPRPTCSRNSLPGSGPTPTRPRIASSPTGSSPCGGRGCRPSTSSAPC